MNPNLSWNYVNKIFSYLSFDRDEFLPFTFDQIKEIIITFKDSELIVLRLTTLYDMIFAQKKEHPRARSSNVEHIKNLTLKLFPIMYITANNVDFIVDLTKFDYNEKEVLDLFVYFLEKAENKKNIDDFESEEEQLENMIPSQTNVFDDKNCTNVLDDVIQTTKPKAICNIDQNDDPNNQNNGSKIDQNNESKNDQNNE